MSTLIAKSNASEFTPTPAGPHSAVCIDVVDRGLQMTQFGAKHKIWIIWAIDEVEESTGKPFITLQSYTLSLHEKSKLGQHLASWRGKPFTEEEKQGFDVEKLLHVPCLLNIVHNVNGGTTYANVDSIMPLPKSMQKVVAPDDYERHIERNPSKDFRSPNYEERQQQQAANQYEPATADVGDGDDDGGLPF